MDVDVIRMLLVTDRRGDKPGDTGIREQ